MVSCFLAVFEIINTFFSNLNYRAFSTRILGYRRKKHINHINRVIFKDRIYTIKLCDALCISYRNISGKYPSN